MNVIKKEFIDAFCTQTNKVVKIHLYSLFLTVQDKKKTHLRGQRHSGTFVDSTYCTLIIFLQEPAITGECELCLDSIGEILIITWNF